MKVCINGQGHMTKMAAMAINSKNLSNLLHNKNAYDFEAWYEASGNGAPKYLIIDDPGMNLTYLMARST